MKQLLFALSLLLFASCQENELFDETQRKLTPIPLESIQNIAKYTSGDFIVTNKIELLNALGEANPGEIVFINGNVEIKIEEEFEISEGVIMASDRNSNGSLGAKIYKEEKKQKVMA